MLRGQALMAADEILHAHTKDDAAERLEPWLELAPSAQEGQLGWLADRTEMTSQLTTLIMAATSNRRRISTLLGRGHPIETRWIPQALTPSAYGRHFSGLLDVAEPTGRLFVSLCLVRLGRPDLRWADAGIALGLPGKVGVTTARACSVELQCSTATLRDAISEVGRELEGDVDYRRRELVVRDLARRRRWYTTWTRSHHPGSRQSSKTYAVTWLWTSYAGGVPSASPGWSSPPTATQLGYSRRYAKRLTVQAMAALNEIAMTGTQNLPEMSVPAAPVDGLKS